MCTQRKMKGCLAEFWVVYNCTFREPLSLGSDVNVQDFTFFYCLSIHSCLHGLLLRIYVNIFLVLFQRRMGYPCHSYIPMILLLTGIISIYTLQHLLWERGIYVFVRNAKMLVFNDNNTICSLFSPKFPPPAGFRTENRMSCVVFIVTCYNCVFQQVNPVRHLFSRQLTCYYFLQICPR